MHISLYIAKRYLFSKNKTNAINIMTLIASGGVAIAATALFVVLSVFAGLKDYSLQFSSFVDPDLKLLPAQGKSFLWSVEKDTLLKNMASIAHFSKILEERVILKSDNKNVLATLKGVDSNYLKVTQIDKMITKGQWLLPGSNDIVAGWGISNQLSFGVFNYLQPLVLYVPKPGKGQLSSLKGAYNAEAVNNIGLFDINEELNNNFIFSDIDLARQLLGYQKNQMSAIALKLHPDADVSAVRDALQNELNSNFIIKDRAQLNDALYKMLNTENLAIYLIFTLVIIIALFNVVGALIMMILDKKKSLSTLFNLGAETKTIRSIFFFQGSLMTVLSGSMGVLIGIIFVLLQQQFGWVMLTPDLPYPVRLHISNILIVSATIFALGILASKIASQRITPNLIQS